MSEPADKMFMTPVIGVSTETTGSYDKSYHRWDSVRGP